MNSTAESSADTSTPVYRAVMMLPLLGRRTISVPTIDAGMARAPIRSGSTTALWTPPSPSCAPKNMAATIVTA